MPGSKHIKSDVTWPRLFDDVTLAMLFDVILERLFYGVTLARLTDTHLKSV